MNSLTYTLDEIERKAICTVITMNQELFRPQPQTIVPGLMGVSTYGAIVQTPFLPTAASKENKCCSQPIKIRREFAFRIKRPFFNVNDVLPPMFGIRITLTPHNTFTSFIADTSSTNVNSEANALKGNNVTFTSTITNLVCFERRKRLCSSALMAYQKCLSQAPRQIRYERTFYQTISIPQNNENMINFNCKLGIYSHVDPKALLFFFTETVAKSNYLSDSHYFLTADVYKYWIDYNGKIIPTNNDLNLKTNGLSSSYSRAYQMLKDALGLHHTDTFSIKYKDGTYVLRGSASRKT